MIDIVALDSDAQKLRFTLPQSVLAWSSEQDECAVFILQDPPPTPHDMCTTRACLRKRVGRPDRPHDDRRKN